MQPSPTIPTGAAKAMQLVAECSVKSSLSAATDSAVASRYGSILARLYSEYLRMSQNWPSRR